MVDQSKVDNTFKVLWDGKSKQSEFDSYCTAKRLREKERIKAEGIGTPKSSRKQNKLLTSPFTLTKYETFFLYEKG